MECLGGAVPNGVTTSNMTLVWQDNTVDVQTATQIAPITYTASNLTAFTLTL